ncbi:class I adenylate-forming enzyme family protein [Sinimarinibacterium thermocellulolyticum]|uniref:Class I adenylate-forming enzyme family protein n=1 Tax=Sinimarinibacterium thermocellulolyticum TaxID=3170016 RepID=A0ABV2A6P9_9GAMM
MNISTILDMAAEAHGERIGVVHGDMRMDYAAVRERAQAAARAIEASGARYLAMLDVSSPAVPIAIFGAAYAGVPYVPLNYRLTKPEINELLARVAPAYVVVGEAYRGSIEPRDDLRLVSRAEFLALPPAADAPLQPDEDPRAIAVQLFTSGTTGKPKAAILRHENLMSYIMGTVEFASADATDAIVVTVPPYHIAGISAVLSSTWACRRIVLLENFEPRAWLDAMRSESVSNAFLVPTMLQRVVEYLDALGESPKLPALRALAYGGGKMPLSTITRAMALFPDVDFTNAYGLTETSSTIAVLGPEDHRAAAVSDDPKIRRRLGSVGKPAAVEIQIRDESGKVLGAEEAGLVFVRGPQVSGEYESLGSQLDADGWFCTRDRGYLDADGYLYLDGRADDVIVRGGENISPGEIEDVLLTHPAVADCACVAIPDEQWGEAVAAAVVLKPDARVEPAELQDLVKARLRSSRVPQTIVFKDSLPYNETGKVLRRVIRQEFAQCSR